MESFVSRSGVERALDGLAEFFHDRQSRTGVVARKMLGNVLPGDDLLVDQLIRERRRRTRMDGGVGGWVIGTTWSALELIQLGCAPDHTGVSRMIGYVLARQDLPGRFGETEDGSYPFGTIQPPLSGFFSPGSHDDKVAPIRFPNGIVVDVEWEARFAASCFALRAVLQARQDSREPVRRHLDSLARVVKAWDSGNVQLPLNLVFFIVAAYAMAPLGDREVAGNFTRRVAELQTEDGDWEGAWLFHAIDAMLLMPMQESLAAVRNSAPAILKRQQSSGGFDETSDEEIALIALRALRTHARSAPIRAPRLSPATTTLRGR